MIRVSSSGACPTCARSSAFRTTWRACTFGCAIALAPVESSFVDDLGADSLDTVELVMALEEEFETEIPDEEAEKITTVQQAVDYIKAHSKS